MKTPYGYRIDPETNVLRICAVEQRTLAKTRELRAAGFSEAAVSKMLTSAGFTPHDAARVLAEDRKIARPARLPDLTPESAGMVRIEPYAYTWAHPAFPNLYMTIRGGRWVLCRRTSKGFNDHEDAITNGWASSESDAVRAVIAAARDHVTP